ncbi:zinc finger protein 610-like [Planococcus citri]|uniref:zinc finger protein 610-like n=1 Tax=Planococcus citri TaxID=170843 RepID=UPI0031F967CB
MSGYKRVNYHELCRLCTSTEGTKIHIYKEEGSRRQLPTKIKKCLPLKVLDNDLLPKMICNNCANKLDEYDNFRQLCLKAESMLQSFRLSLKCTGKETDKLPVYVKDVQLQATLVEKSPVQQPETQIRSSVQVPNVTNVFQNTTDNESDNRVVALMTLPSRIGEETGQMPLQCSAPLKLNGVPSSVVPVNVENLSSLMQVVPDNDISRIQQFELPLQTEMAVVNDANNTRYNVSIPTGNSDTVIHQKDVTNVIQSLQCEINEDGNINLNKIIQSNSASGNVSYGEASIPVSIVASSQTGLTSNTTAQDVVMQVDLTIDDSNNLKSCGTCGKILSDPNEICNHTIVRPATSSESNMPQQNAATSVIQSVNSIFTPTKPSRKAANSDQFFKCDVCEKPFRKKEHLFQHRKLHSGERPYVCGSCGKSFSRKEHLFRHTLAHTGEKTHSCNICGKTFSRKDNLHKHQKTHGINGPYECEICGKSFIVKHYFLMHQANHGTDDNEELPFQCEICKKGFIKKEFLNSHKVRHRVRVNPQVSAAESTITTTSQLEENDLMTINSVAILSPNIVQQTASDTIYISAQPSAFTLTATGASNTTTATQTPLFSTALTETQLLENYCHLTSTAVSS